MDISAVLTSVLGTGVSKPAHARHHVRVQLKKGQLQREIKEPLVPFVIGSLAKAASGARESSKWLPLVVGRAPAVLNVPPG